MIKFLLRKLGFLAPKAEISVTDVNLIAKPAETVTVAPAVAPVEAAQPAKKGRKPRQNAGMKAAKKPKVN